MSARDSFQRFLGILCSSYSCLDVWFRKSNDKKRGFLRKKPVMECRIMYIQSDPDYTGTNSWERNGERARQWQTFRGTEKQIRTQILGVLPRLAQLTESKRHGEYVFGATAPYTGQGGLVYYDEDSGVVVIAGRVGEIVISGDGVDFNWEDIEWSFDGCNTQRTYDPGDNDVEVCIKEIGSPVEECEDIIVDPGPDPTGCCELPRPDCEILWGYTDEQLASLNVNGVTENWCSKFRGNWQQSVSCLPYNNATRILECGNPKPTGCCIIGDCTNYSYFDNVTRAQCSNLAGGQEWQHYTAAQGFATCTEQDVRDHLECDESPPAGVPSSFTISIQSNVTGQYAGYCSGNHATWSGTVSQQGTPCGSGQPNCWDYDENQVWRNYGHAVGYLEHANNKMRCRNDVWDSDGRYCTTQSTSVTGTERRSVWNATYTLTWIGEIDGVHTYRTSGNTVQVPMVVETVKDEDTFDMQSPISPSEIDYYTQRYYEQTVELQSQPGYIQTTYGVGTSGWSGASWIGGPFGTAVSVVGGSGTFTQADPTIRYRSVHQEGDQFADILRFKTSVTKSDLLNNSDPAFREIVYRTGCSTSYVVDEDYFNASDPFFLGFDVSSLTDLTDDGAMGVISGERWLYNGSANYDIVEWGGGYLYADVTATF